jgi:hypothetical protein
VGDDLLLKADLRQPGDSVRSEDRVVLDRVVDRTGDHMPKPILDSSAHLDASDGAS